MWGGAYNREGRSYNICTEKEFVSGSRAGQITDHSNKLSRIDLACIVQLCTGRVGDPQWWFILILVNGALSPSPHNGTLSVYITLDEFNPHASFLYFRAISRFSTTLYIYWYMIWNAFWPNWKNRRNPKTFTSHCITPV